MPEVALGVLKVKRSMFGPNIDNRLIEFGHTVDQANSVLKRPTNGPRVLVVPEYYWAGHDIIRPVPGVQVRDRKAKEGGGNSSTSHTNSSNSSVTTSSAPQTMVQTITNDKKKAIYQGLKNISQRAGDLVLVAGSIFYQKTGYGFGNAYNVCPVLRYGQVILKDFKVFDDGHAASNDLAFSCKASEPYFSVDGVHFGLDICGEHNDEHDEGANIHYGGRLKKWVARDDSRRIDIHIVIAEGAMPSTHSFAARKEGYYVFCDSYDGHAIVWPGGKWFSKQNRLQSSMAPVPQVNGAELHSFVLTV